MSEAQEAATQPQFSLQKIYVKDLSFETPNSPLVFREAWEPEINLQLSNQGRLLGDGVHEVVLTVTVTAKLGEKTAYLTEVQQAGIFGIQGYNQQDLNTLIGVYCPNILFPYAREVVSDLVARGGFPQLLLSPVNFEALYTQHAQQLAQEPGGQIEQAH